VSWGSGVRARCKFAELTVDTGALVGCGTAVGAVGAVVDPGIAVGATEGAVVDAGIAVAAGGDVAVAEEPQATMNTKSIVTSTKGFFRMGSSITQPPNVGSTGNYQFAAQETRDDPP